MDTQKTAIWGNKSNCEPSSNRRQAQKWVPVKQRVFAPTESCNRPVIGPTFTKLTSIDSSTGLKGEAETVDDIIGRSETACQSNLREVTAYLKALSKPSVMIRHQLKLWLQHFGDLTCFSFCFIHALSQYDWCKEKSNDSVAVKALQWHFTPWAHILKSLSLWQRHSAKLFLCVALKTERNNNGAGVKMYFPQGFPVLKICILTMLWGFWITGFTKMTHIVRFNQQW